MLVSLWWTDIVHLQPLILKEQLVCHCKYIYTWKQPLIKSGYFNIVTFKVPIDDKLLTKQPSCLLHHHRPLFSKKCSSWFKWPSVALDSCWVFTSLSGGILSLFLSCLPSPCCDLPPITLIQPSLLPIYPQFIALLHPRAFSALSTWIPPCRIQQAPMLTDKA